MQNEKQQIASDEISLKDMFDVLTQNRLLIAIFGLAGLLFSAVYIVLAPKIYEARWQIQMAQFINSNSEEPTALMERLREPTTYPVEVQQSCGIPEDRKIDDYLGGMLQVNVIKNVVNLVGMKVFARSPDQAKKCAEAIVMMIVVQQRGLIEERLAGRKDQLVLYKQALAMELQQLEEIKTPELGHFGYLARLDKLSWLRTRIDALQEEAMMSQLHPAKLTAPVFVLSKPVSPKVGLIITLGLLLGLMLGVLYVLGRDGWRREL